MIWMVGCLDGLMDGLMVGPKDSWSFKLFFQIILAKKLKFSSKSSFSNNFPNTFDWWYSSIGGEGISAKSSRTFAKDGD